MSQLLEESKFCDYTPIEGVYVIPPFLTKTYINEIYKVTTVNAHHGDEGHGDGGHRIPPKSEPTLFQADKPYRFTRLAKLIFKNLPIITHNGLTATSVDGDMQIYTLPEGGGIVPVHIDKDFEVSESVALYSILIYLNDGYTGGETVFNRNMFSPKVDVGGGIVFRHDILHEGLEVISGEKHVLKTDLLFSLHQ